MPDDEKPATFAQHFLGRSSRRTTRVLRSASEEPAQPSLFSPSPPPPPGPPAPTPPRLIPAPPREPRVWSVRALVSDIRQHIELGYVDVRVEGEISNCRPAASGHIYLTLKDGDAALPVVLFRREAQLLRFRPADGLAVLVRGRLSVYESRGQLQLIADTMEARGAGALQLAFEQLKARLLAEGLFDSARKRPIPLYPKCVGVITSPTGAVIRDIVTVIRRRHSCLNLLVYPVPVQGAACAASVVRALRWFNAHPGRADLLVLARGGGSLEDLAGFNDEAVARAIAASVLPVVSAIGHETDVTIADFTADLRAPTPSAAAELITAAQHRIAERVDALSRAVHRAGRYHLLHARQRFGRLSTAYVLARVYDSIGRRQQRLDDLRQRLELALSRVTAVRQRRLETLSARLARQSAHARLAASAARVASLNARLHRAVPATVSVRRAVLGGLASRLHALSPVAVLSRGYALVYTAEGSLISSAAEIAPGASIRARLAHGSLTARVTETRPQTSPETPDS